MPQDAMSEISKQTVKRLPKIEPLGKQYRAMAHLKSKTLLPTKAEKEAYVARTGKSPNGPKFDAWFEQKTGGDFSDSGMRRAFGGDGSPRPLKKGERTIPEKAYMREFGELPEDDGYPTRAPKGMFKTKSVEVGVGDKAKKAAIARVKANMAGESSRRARREADIESY